MNLDHDPDTKTFCVLKNKEEKKKEKICHPRRQLVCMETGRPKKAILKSYKMDLDVVLLTGF